MDLSLLSCNVGTTVRLDTTLIGFEKLSWQRGHQTLIFQATRKDLEIDLEPFASQSFIEESSAIRSFCSVNVVRLSL